MPSRFVEECVGIALVGVALLSMLALAAWAPDADAEVTSRAGVVGAVGSTGAAMPGTVIAGA